MILLLDESEANHQMILGGILLPDKVLPELEADFVRLRLKHKLLAELKWNSIDQYYKRYCEFIDLFFNNREITYHSICYRRRGSEKYKAAYSLIRTITWKMQNAKINEPLYIIFDNDGKLGADETKKIREMAKKDPLFKQALDFCNQGTSHILGGLQIADLLTGAVCAKVNSVRMSPEHQLVHDYVQKQNGGTDLNYSSLSLPKLYAHKIHYFDPDVKSVRVVSK